MHDRGCVIDRCMTRDMLSEICYLRYMAQGNRVDMSEAYDLRYLI